MAIYLGASPNSCKEQVEKYWKEHGKPNFTIKDFKTARKKSMKYEL